MNKEATVSIVIRATAEFLGAQVLGMLIALTLVVPVITASKEKNNV